MVIPGTAKGIVLSLLGTYGYTELEIAKQIKVSLKTIQRIRNDSVPSEETDLQLILFYIRVRINEEELSRALNLATNKNAFKSENQKEDMHRLVM